MGMTSKLVAGAISILGVGLWISPPVGATTPTDASWWSSSSQPFITMEHDAAVMQSLLKQHDPNYEALKNSCNALVTVANRVIKFEITRTQNIPHSLYKSWTDGAIYLDGASNICTQQLKHSKHLSGSRVKKELSEGIAYTKSADAILASAGINTAETTTS
jgi:hypothetical protein